MADYIVTGKKGDGKSLVCVGKIRDWLLSGRKVATNLNLNLEKLLPRATRNVQVYRLPDYPTVEDMEAIGKGCDSVDEDKYGLIVLDEMAVWMNARDWGDKRRAALLSWFVHSRKHRWHSMFITQGMAQLDKQFRESLADHQVSCRRLDKVRIPFVGMITKNLMGFEVRPPKIHVAAVRYGMGKDAMLSDRWSYRGHDLYAAYDTEQVFAEDYEHGIFSYLTPWHLLGRHEPKPETLREWIRHWVNPPPPARLPPKEKHPLVALVERLPAHERLRHLHRLQALGAL